MPNSRAPNELLPSRFNIGNPILSSDIERIKTIITSVNISESRLNRLINQAGGSALKKEISGIDMDSSNSTLISDIEQESVNLMATWELLKETVDGCFKDNPIENPFAAEIKSITERVNRILPKTTKALERLSKNYRGEEYAKENTGNKNRKK